MTEGQQVLTAHAAMEARSKLQRLCVEPKLIDNPRTILEAMDGVSLETDPNLHELRCNLLVKEMSTASVHPEIPRILARLTTDDANLLLKIAKDGRGTLPQIQILQGETDRGRPDPFRAILRRRQFTLNHRVLESANLIEHDDVLWLLTELGRSFIDAVSDPEEQTAKQATTSS